MCALLKNNDAIEYEFTAHLTPYGSLGVLHLLPAQPLHAHVVGVRGVGS